MITYNEALKYSNQYHTKLVKFGDDAFFVTLALYGIDKEYTF